MEKKSQKIVAPGKPVTTDPEGVWQLIQQKAQELWEQRGKREGYALDDWLEAEEIVMDELHESRE
jgi:hypothetical protein